MPPMRYRLRTLLILLAIGPPLLAGGYWTWDRLRPQPSPWLTEEDFKPFIPPGPEFKLSVEAARLKAAKANIEASTDNRP